jgi:phospholipase/lecithinase/hemolysin
MGRLRLLFLAATLTVSALTVTAADPVSAQSTDTADVFGQSLDEILSAYPDAQRLPNGSYQLEPGVRLVPPASPSDSGAGINEWPSGCSDRWVCFWQHANFQGWSLSYYYCSPVFLNSPFKNNISSIHNAQNNATTNFADVEANPDVWGSLGSNRYLRDLSKDPAPDGRSWNDRIDLIDPC